MLSQRKSAGCSASVLPRLASTSAASMAIWALLACGLGLRAIWSLTRDSSGASGEAFNVARAIGVGRGFADAYMAGQGPTAHLTPISPAVAGAAYKLFGVHGRIAELLLFLWASVLVFGSFLLFMRVFRRLGTPLQARIAAFAFLCISPAYLAQEAVDFRIWEGGLAVFISAVFLDRLFAAAVQMEISKLRLASLGATAALLFFINPPLGLGGCACAVVFGLERLRLTQLMFGAVVAIGTMAILIVPWTMRNEAQLGAFVPLRSNTGLELAIADHPAAVSSDDPGRVFAERLHAIHPAQSPTAYAAMRSAGGEVPYSRKVGTQAKRWIVNNPGAAALLAVRHVKETFAPEPWQFSVFGTGKLAFLRSFLATLAGVGGLFGLIAALIRKRHGWIYPSLFVIVPILSLAPFQPVPRYTYLFYPLLVFCAADLLASLASALPQATRALSKTTKAPKGRSQRTRIE